MSFSMMNDSFINYVNKTYDAYKVVRILVAGQRGEINATPLPEDIGSREAREPHVIFVQCMSKANSFDAWKKNMSKFILSKALLEYYFIIVLLYCKKDVDLHCRNKINHMQIILDIRSVNINFIFYTIHKFS